MTPVEFDARGFALLTSDYRGIGVRRIGHFGFFREQFRNTLWPDAAE